jgi:hypothetical protein
MIIRGNTVGTTTPRSNWNQNDPKKVDYVVGKEAVDAAIAAAQKTADNAQAAADNAQAAADNAQRTSQKKHISRTATLTASGWVDNMQTVEVDGVTSNNTLLVASAPENYEEYSKASVYCSAQAVGSMTFLCKSVPTIDLIANIMILP